MSLIKKIQFHFSRLFRPVMDGYIYDSSGKRIYKTRISNTTCIGNRENLQLGEHVFIGHHNYIDASNGVTIEEGCQITNFISILSHSSHIAIRLYGKKYTEINGLKGYERGEVKVGKYTFVGPHSVIMPGTNIGKGCLVKAYSYVKGEFEDFAVIGGNPAQKVGDTRELDQPYLDRYPQLKESYKEWAD